MKVNDFKLLELFLSHIPRKMNFFSLHKREAKRFQSCDQAEAECHVRFAAGEVRNAVMPPISLPDLRETITVRQYSLGFVRKNLT